MKKTLLLSAAALAACTAFAAAPISFSVGADFEKAAVNGSAVAGKIVKAPTRATQSVDYTYAKGYSGSYSFKGLTAGVSRVYMMFMMSQEDVELFAGNTVTAFSVVSASDYNGRINRIYDGRFFISTTLEDMDYVQDFEFSHDPQTLTTTAIDEPYTIKGTENGIAFGYSFVVPESNDMYYLPVDGVKNKNPYSNIVGVSEDETFPTQLGTYASDLGALVMFITIEGENLPNGAKISNIYDPSLLKQGQDWPLPVSLEYYSTTEVNSVDVAYALDGKDYTFHYDLPEPAPAAVPGSISFNLIVPAQDKLFNENVEFSVVKINDKANEMEDSSFSANVYVVEDVPVHQTLFEEYTGTWCGYCSRGYAALEYIRENYPEFVVAAYHNNDAMQVTNNYPSSIGGYPYAVLDRNVGGDPYYGSNIYKTVLPIVDEIVAMNAVPTPWAVSVSHTWDSETELTANVEVKNVLGFENGKYKIVYILVADGLSGKTSSWYQSNYYSSDSQSSSYIPQLNAFCRGGKYGSSKVKGLEFNDVVVSTTGIYGVSGSVPEALAAGEVASHSLTFDLSGISKTLIPDKDKLRIIAAVADSNGNILNSAKDEVNDFTGSAVEGVNVDSSAPVEYFNLNGVKVADPSDGIFIRRQGNSVSKVVVK